MPVNDLDVACVADPFGNDENFLLSMLTLEELGATGNKARSTAPSELHASIFPYIGMCKATASPLAFQASHDCLFVRLRAG